MAFFDDFNRIDSSEVGNGWVDLSGRGGISNNRLVISGGGSFPDNLIYSPEPFKNGTLSVTFNTNNYSGAVPQLQARVDLTGSNSGYVAYLVDGNFRIARFVGTSLTTISTTAISVSINTDYKLIFTLDGNNLTAEVRDSTTDALIESLSGADSTYSASGLNGVSYNGTGTAQYDDFSATTAVEPSLSIDVDNYQIKNRGSGDRDFNITGTYAGNPTGIEFSLNGGAYATAVANPSGGAWSHTLSLSEGQHSVTYRLSNDVTSTATLSNIAVGEVIACAGQSNMVGWLGSNQVYNDSTGGITGYLFGNDDNYKQLSDPYDSASGQVDAVSDDGANAKGSWIVRFANAWLANNEVPIGFIPAAKGGSSVQEWQKDDTTNVVGGLNLYQSMARRINAVGGVNCVFYQQGEADCLDQTPVSTYKAKLKQFCDDILADFGVNVMIIPLHTITRSAYTIETATTGQTLIRQAQVELAQENAHIDIAPPLTDIDLTTGDDLHFATDADLNTVAVRVYDAYVGNVSNLNVTVAGIPDGTHSTLITDSLNNIVYANTVTYSSGTATIPNINVNSGTALRGFVISDDELNGAVITGTTV